MASSGINYITAMRDFILEKGWNAIRMDYSTSKNRDGVTQDNSMFTDGVHLNRAGNNVMYRQGVIELGMI